ncbi:MAG: lamin tail domain-containing protein [Candidatus Andersenbacteria bacterium]
MNKGTKHLIALCGKHVDGLWKSGDNGYGLSILGFLGALLVVLFTPSVLTAEGEGGVIISEIMWAGGEYVEIYNNSQVAVSLKGWKITRQKNESEEEKTVAQLTSDRIVQPGAFFLLQEVGATTVSPDEERSSITLVDTGEVLRLYTKDGVLVDIAGRFESEGSWFAGVNTSGGVSMERVLYDADGEIAESWIDSLGVGGGRQGTPAEASIQITPSPPSISPSSAPSSAPVASPSVIPTPYLSTVIVNEFLPDPTGDDTLGEFIELKNTGTAAANLDGWQLDDEEGGSLPYGIPTGTLIPAGETMLFMRPDTKISLNNDGDQVRFLSPDGVLQSSVAYDDATSGYAYAYDTQTKTYRQTTTPTPGSENVFTIPPVPTPKISSTENATGTEEEEEVGQLSDAIVISEVLPNPIGSDTEGEFIELYNSGSSEINLVGWRLDDVLDGGSIPYRIPVGTRIGGGKFLVFERAQTKLALNNSNETVHLLDPAGTVKSLVSFTDSIAEGVSLARAMDGSYVLTTTVTKGADNLITAPGSLLFGAVGGVSRRVLSIEQSRQMPQGSIVNLEGVVSAAPGILGKGIVYLSGSGIQLYLGKGEWPLVELGERIRVTGKLSSIAGEARILVSAVSDVERISTDEPPEPHIVKTSDIREELEGFLVEVQGLITRSSGSTFYIDDGSGEARITVKDSTGIKKPRTSKGMAVRITGIVSQTAGGYRILPRFQGDLVIGGGVVSSTKVTTRSSSASAPADLSAESTADPINVFEAGDVSYAVEWAQGGGAATKSKQNIFVVFGVGAALFQAAGAAAAGEPLLRSRRLATKEQWQ